MHRKQKEDSGAGRHPDAGKFDRRDSDKSGDGKMTRLSREVGIVKSCILGEALAACLALPAQAGDKKLVLGGTAALTTDYIFRGISQTGDNPAVQASVDATYGMFYLGAWGSNVDFGNVVPNADIEIDYYGGIRPMWKGITFDIGGIYYTYPGACEAACGLGDPDYFELKTGAAYTFGQKLTLAVTNYWSPDFGAEFGDGDAVEGTAAYAFSGKLFNFFSPSISGLFGYQTVDLLGDYTYWNVGLTLGFMEKWSADVRYWDTDASDATCLSYVGFTTNCEPRVVGTLKAVF
ncbi:MAG: hypothetical protein H7X74_03095 [Methyloceanibacter sp.]|nr:hypothetical protein [Methyloceanibacter sp.]